MIVERYLPAEALRPFIKTFMIIESEDGRVNRALPDTSIVMAFRFKGSTYAQADRKKKIPPSALSGLTDSIRTIEYSDRSASLLVMFTEGGARSYFKEPLHELFGLHLPLDNFFKRQQLTDIEEQLAEARQNSQRVPIVEQFLCSELKEIRDDPLIEAATQRIRSSDGTIRIADLVKSLAISRDPFEKRFRRAIGSSPKQFARILRLRKLIDLYPRSNNFTEAAHAAGYFDQSHFIKDFKAFTGQNPTDFFQSVHW